MRSKPQSLGLSDNDSIAVRVRGDGREYSLNLYIPTFRTAFSYRASIQTKKGEWIEARLPISDFYATSFGRRVENGDPVGATKVNSLGFLLSDRKAGPFKLEVAWIKVVGSWRQDQKQVRTELPQPPTGKDWKLVWSDEVNGKDLTRQKWEVPSNR